MVSASVPAGIFGELRVTEDAGGPVLHGPRRRGAEIEITPDEAALREHVRFDQHGRYRPLSGARSLRGGWRVACGPEFAVEDAIEVVYPLALAHRRLFEAGILELVTLGTVLQRQGGRYEVAGGLPAEAGERASDVLCAGCVRTPAWRGEAVAPAGIPCPEPCSVLVSLCREAALWESSPPAPAAVDATVAFAAFDAPGNEVREEYPQPALPKRQPRTLSAMDNASVREAARALFPGGVNSPVRSFRSVGGAPVPLIRGEGARVFDVDGRRYIDYIGAFGPLILGHAPAAVVEAVKAAAATGTAFGALTPGEVELGRRVQAATGLERLRFVNSGTEATMTAIRLARAATGRDLVVKFDGCYHGHSDGLLVKAGSGVATLGLSDSAGVPEAIAGLTAVLPYNDPAALRGWFGEHGAETAAVIVETIAGNMGLVRPTQDFLDGLQDVPHQHGALLIADEVINGFRLRNGLTGLLPEADLVCLGKVIGGGLPVGAFGGRAEIMDLLAPNGPVYQAGTLSGNPLVMAAGVAMLDALAEPSVYRRLDELGRHLENGLNAAIRRAEAPASVTRVGSMLTLFFRPEPPTDYAQARESDTAMFGRFHGAMLERGVMLPPSQFETWFVSAAHREADLDETVKAAHEAMRIAAPVA